MLKYTRWIRKVTTTTMAAKKKPVPVPKKLKAKPKKESFTEAERAGFDVAAYIARVKDLGQQHVLMHRISEETECPIYKLPDQDLLTIPILEEILEALDGN